MERILSMRFIVKPLDDSDEPPSKEERKQMNRAIAARLRKELDALDGEYVTEIEPLTELLVNDK